MTDPAQSPADAPQDPAPEPRIAIRRRYLVIIGATFVALVAAIVALAVSGGDGSTPSATSGADSFHDYLLAIGRTERVAVAEVASATSYCALVDSDGGDISRVIVIATNGDVPIAAEVEVLNGMSKYVCPKYAAAISEWANAH